MQETYTRSQKNANIVVSAADTSHAVSIARLSGLVRDQMPDWKLYIWDLGMTSEDRDILQSNNPDVEVRSYPYSKLPDWHNVKLAGGEYAFKPQACMRSITDDTKMLAWIDAGCVFYDGLDSELRVAKEHGVYSRYTTGTIEQYTDTRVLDLWGMSPEHRQLRMRASGLMFFDLSRALDIVRTWYHASYLRDMWAPEGSMKHPLEKGDKTPRYNHRQDQSIINIVLAQAGIHDQIPGDVCNWKAQHDIDHRPRNVR